MVCFVLILLVLTLIFLCLYLEYHRSWMLPVYVTLLTTFYHFAMRIAVGEAVTVIYKKRKFNINSLGFRIHGYEHRLFEFLNVKRWKSRVITAKPEQFEVRKLSPEELLHNMLQAELVHRIIMVLSFLPLLLIIPYGKPLVFVLTSVFACLIDLIFVIIQRYNRPRAVRLIKRYRK